MTEKIMRLLNPHTGEMVCKVCGSRHWASIRPVSNGYLYRGSWQCVHGCRLEDKAAVETNKRHCSNQT